MPLSSDFNFRKGFARKIALLWHRICPMQTLTPSNSDDFSASIRGLLRDPKLRHLVAQAQWLGQLSHALHHTLADSVLAEHCAVADFKRGRLLIMTDSAAWLTRLNFKLPEVENQLRCHTLFPGLSSIAVQIQPPAFKPPQTIRAKPKLSQANADLLRQTASHIKDEKLRRALEKLALNTD